MKSFYITIVILVVSIIGAFYTAESLNKEELIECTCYKKYDAVSKRGTRNFYMVLDTPKESFTLKVSPKTYFSTNEGNKVSFKLRPTEYKQNTLTLITQLFFIFGCVFSFILVVCVIVMITNHINIK